MPKILLAILICITINILTLCYAYLKSKEPISFEEKIKDWSIETNNQFQFYQTTNKIVWAKRNMTFLLEDGRIEELQIGLDPKGYFIWKKIQKNNFNYK